MDVERVRGFLVTAGCGCCLGSCLGCCLAFRFGNSLDARHRVFDGQKGVGGTVVQARHARHVPEKVQVPYVGGQTVGLHELEQLGRQAAPGLHGVHDEPRRPHHLGFFVRPSPLLLCTAAAWSFTNKRLFSLVPCTCLRGRVCARKRNAALAHGGGTCAAAHHACTTLHARRTICASQVNSREHAGGHESDESEAYCRQYP